MNNKIKILASDFDGTLFYNGKISDKDLEMIKIFREKGNKFGIVTGRNYSAVQKIYDTVGLEVDFVICCTGALIFNSNGKIIKSKTEKIFDNFNELISDAVLLNSDRFILSLEKLCFNIDLLNGEPYDLKGIEEFSHCNINFETCEDAYSFLKLINHKYKNKINGFQNNSAVDIPPLNTSKITGIYDYSKEFENKEIYTIGDNDNDIGMVKEFNGFAVSNATNNLKKIANTKFSRVSDIIKYLIDL